MKKLSLWASRHKWPARLLLVFSLQLLNLTGIATGLLLKDQGLYLPSFSFLLIVFIYFAAVVYYPKKREKQAYAPGVFYRRQKLCDGLLAAAAFLMFVCISNDKTPFQTYFSGYGVASANVPAAVKDSSFNPFRMMVTFAKSMRDKDGHMLKWKERKVLLKEQAKMVKQSTELSRGSKTLLTILLILVASGLILLALGLACNLSCNGHDGGAVLVGVGGTALIIFLVVVGIRALYPGKRRKLKQALKKEDETGK